MIFSLSFKTPDVKDQLDDDQREDAEAVIEKFVNYGEYVHIQFDTETQTATVIPQ